jgi:hypothetical protein
MRWKAVLIISITVTERAKQIPIPRHENTGILTI